MNGLLMQLKNIITKIRYILSNENSDGFFATNKSKIGYAISYFSLFLLVSIPIMNNYLFSAHDIYFHLMRIEGLAQGLAGGQFPVRIQPGWYGGYGYSCSVFYGDTFLYLPALFRLIGVSLQNSYKIYLIFCNIGTIMIAGFSFGKIFNNRYIGLIGSALYSMAVYRLMNLYVRASLGEYTGMMFLPLVIYAVFLLLKKERTQIELKKGAFFLGLSMAFFLQSHILTAEIVVILLMLVFVVNIKKVWNKEVISAGMKAVGWCLGLSAWFIIPFIDYMISGKFNVNAINAGPRVEGYIQHNGAFFSQLGKMFDHAGGGNLSVAAGTEGEMALGVGFVLFIAGVVFFAISILMKEFRKDKIWKFTGGCWLLSVLSLWMSTIHFPWDYIRSSNKLFRYMVINIQFPWRFSGIASVFLVGCWCGILAILYQKDSKKIVVRISIVLMGMMLLSSGYFIRDILAKGEPIVIESTQDMNTYVKSGEEYLPVNTNVNDLSPENLIIEEGLQIENQIRKGVSINFDCTNTTSIFKILELPLLYYDGYRAEYVNEEGKKGEFEVYAGNNNVARMVIPEEFSGHIEVKFSSPWYWRVGELITIASIIISLFLLSHMYRQKETSREQA